MTLRLASSVLLAALIALGATTTHAQDAGATKCSVKSLRGSYAFKASGVLYSAVPPPGTPPGPVTLIQVGVATFDGNGGMTMTGMNSLAGYIFPSPPNMTGTYTLDPDCTGTIGLNDMFSDTIYVALSDEGKRMFGLYTTTVDGGTKPGPAITLDFARQ